MDTNAELHVVVATRAVAPQHGHGGLEKAAAYHLRHLARRGVRLTVFTQPPYSGAPPSDLPPELVAWREVPYRSAPLPLRRNSIPDRLLHYGAFARRVGRAIAELARRERVDVVHAHGLAGAGYAREIGREGATQRRRGRAGDGQLPPLVLNPHGLEEFSRRNRAKALAYAPFRRGVRATAAAAAAVIATDRSLERAIARRLRVPAARIATIPNGVDVEDLDRSVRPDLVRELRERYRLASSPLTLASVARLERNKGLHIALATLAALRDRLPEGWRWLIVGAGGEERRLRALIGQLGLGRNVALLGALPDEAVQSLLEAVDLFVVPSLYEGSSLAALEAMARRLPVLATATGGLPDKVRPGLTGFLAPPGDPAGLRAALAGALDRRAEWREFGRRGRDLVEAEFDWARLADRYLALYAALRAETARTRQSGAGGGAERR